MIRLKKLYISLELNSKLSLFLINKIINNVLLQLSLNLIPILKQLLRTERFCIILKKSINRFN